VIFINKEKKVPLRMCVACRQMKEKKELIKVTKPKEGLIQIDETGKLPGRGAYVCKNPDCVKKAKKARGFERAFKCALPEDLYEKLDEVAKDG